MTDISLSYQKTAALTAAIKLGIFTHIGKHCLSVEQIAGVTGGSVRGVRILCDFLCVIGRLEKKTISLHEEEKQSQLRRLSELQERHKNEAPKALTRLKKLPLMGDSFAGLMETVKQCGCVLWGRLLRLYMKWGTVSSQYLTK